MWIVSTARPTKVACRSAPFANPYHAPPMKPIVHPLSRPGARHRRPRQPASGRGGLFRPARRCRRPCRPYRHDRGGRGRALRARCRRRSVAAHVPRRGPEPVGGLVADAFASDAAGAVLRAGAVGWGDKAILVAGYPGAGASSLVAWLIENGFSYLADEIVAIAADGASLTGLPGPLSFRQIRSPTSPPCRRSMRRPRSRSAAACRRRPMGAC